MSVSKDLTITVTNEAEGVTLVFKTVSSLGKEKVFISGDAAVHDVKEIEEALKSIEEFNKEDDEKVAEAFGLIQGAVTQERERENQLEGIHLP